jgi:hypothetical protein
MAISYMQKKGFVGLNGTDLYVFQRPLLEIWLPRLMQMREKEKDY